MSTETLLEVKSVSKRFGEIEALSSVDIRINSGQVIGLVGGNGAGKTTLLRLIAGVIEPTNGEVLLGMRKFHKSDKKSQQEKRSHEI